MVYCRKPLTQPMFLSGSSQVAFHPACQPWDRDKWITVETTFLCLKNERRAHFSSGFSIPYLSVCHKFAKFFSCLIRNSFFMCEYGPYTWNVIIISTSSFTSESLLSLYKQLWRAASAASCSLLWVCTICSNGEVNYFDVEKHGDEHHCVTYLLTVVVLLISAVYSSFSG